MNFRPSAHRQLLGDYFIYGNIISIIRTFCDRKLLIHLKLLMVLNVLELIEEYFDKYLLILFQSETKNSK